jgi:hypothetical protein
MKRKGFFLNVAVVIVSLLLGVVLGVIVDLPKTSSDNLKGTIGKVDKHRNVNITDADLQLRSELIGDQQKCEGYLNYYTFHYGMVAQLTIFVDSAIVASEQNADFAKENTQLVSGLKTYLKNIENPRAELLLAVLTLQNIHEVEEAAISAILNNANMAIARLTYNENIIANFTSAALEFIKKYPASDNDALIVVHDNLSMLQFTKALITKDKPMIKYYDKHEVFSDVENLGAVRFSSETLNLLVILDSERLQTGFTDQSQLEGNESLNAGIWHNQERLGLLLIWDAQKLQNAEALMGKMLLNIENLGVHSNALLGSHINGNFSSEQLHGIFTNVENLGMVTYYTPNPNGPF